MNDKPQFSADKSKFDPAEDLLDYAPFAKHLAHSLNSMAPRDGFVVALYGPWGSGKSTLLEFVVHYLNQLPEDEKPVIVRFNPWWFSGEEALSRHFFGQILSVLDGRSKVFEEVRNRLADLANIASKIPAVGSVAEAAEIVFRPGEKSVVQLKEEIGDLFKKQSKRIIVLVDDIDRLSAEEIRQVFRLIKAVADFPNVVYLLAFDKEVVVRSLEEIQGGVGEEYLEKIVQVPFNLPNLTQTAINGLFIEEINKIVQGTPEELLGVERWSEIFPNGIERFLNTPRDAVRLANAIALTYPAILGEVNAIDFIAVESLRIFASEVYDIVRLNSDQFTGAISYGEAYRFQLEELNAFHSNWTAKIPTSLRDASKKILTSLFPKLTQTEAFRSFGWTNNDATYWRKERRIASSTSFEIYFRFSVPHNQLSRKQFNKYLDIVCNEDFSSTVLSLWDNDQSQPDKRLKDFLLELDDRSQQLQEKQILCLLRTFFEVGDKLIHLDDEKQFKDLFDFGIARFLTRQILALLRNIDKSLRLPVLTTSTADTSCVMLITQLCITLGREHNFFEGKSDLPENEKLLTLSDFGMFHTITLKQVKAVAENRTLLDMPAINQILAFWLSTEPEEAKTWVTSISENDDELLKLLSSFVFISRSYSNHGTTLTPTLNPEWFEPYIEITQLVQRVEILFAKDNLTEVQQKVLSLFLQSYRDRDNNRQQKSPVVDD